MASTKHTLKFKMGDKVRHIESGVVGEIFRANHYQDENDDMPKAIYEIQGRGFMHSENVGTIFFDNEEHEWELV